MISRLKGTILSRTPTEVVLDVNGVGYQVSVPVPTSEALAGVIGRLASPVDAARSRQRSTSASSPIQFVTTKQRKRA